MAAGRHGLPCVAAAVWLAAASGGCAHPEIAVEIAFAARLGGEPLACEPAAVDRAALSLTDLRFYVSDVRLRDEAGHEVAARLLSGNSPYDRYMRGETDALSASARRGLTVFQSERLECFHCHGGFNFADSVDHAKLPEPERAFHNTGLYNLDGRGAYPASDRGLYERTHAPADMGRFKAPTLRNVAVTAPYMHDGSIATLGEAIDHYAAGGRTIASGANAGDGSLSPLKDQFVTGFVLTDQEHADLIAFLEALTDETFLTDPRFADPFDGVSRAAS
jgi:cytochrome c peroxidase